MCNLRTRQCVIKFVIRWSIIVMQGRESGRHVYIPLYYDPAVPSTYCPRHWTVRHPARVKTQSASDGVNSIQECPTRMPHCNPNHIYHFNTALHGVARRCISEKSASFASSRLAVGNQYPNQASLDIITIKML